MINGLFIGGLYYQEVEEWRDVINLKNYYRVSNIGRIYSIRNKKTLKSYNPPNLYPRVHISVDGLTSNIDIHVAVAEAFICPRPIGMHVNHKNGIKKDNRAENLEWITPKENIEHAIENGLAKQVSPKGGEDHHFAVISNLDRYNLLYKWAMGKHTQKELSIEFDIKVGTVKSIISRFIEGNHQGLDNVNFSLIKGKIGGHRHQWQILAYSTEQQVHLKPGI